MKRSIPWLKNASLASCISLACTACAMAPADKNSEARMSGLPPVTDHDRVSHDFVFWNAAMVTTFAGSPGSYGGEDGVGGAARFFGQHGITVDNSGNVYVADFWNHAIRKITPSGSVSTFAGRCGSKGSADGARSAARFDYPAGVAADSSGNVFVADAHNHTIRQISAQGVVTTLAGLAGSSGSADGVGSAARFNLPEGVAFDGEGNVYVADCLNHTIRKITPTGAVTTLAGLAGSPGGADGAGGAARFNGPSDVATDSAGNIYVADRDNHTIRMITASGVVSTLAGLAGAFGSADGPGSAARFFNPSGLAVDTNGSIFVADERNHTIRVITPRGLVMTLAGSPGSPGYNDGTADAARFNYPWDVALENTGDTYVSDLLNHSIRKLSPLR